MSEEQKDDVALIFAGWRNAGNLDYVACWYKKTADYMKDTQIRAALVSTNSICQGETVGNLWKPLFNDGVHIDFAYRTFTVALPTLKVSPVPNWVTGIPLLLQSEIILFCLVLSLCVSCPGWCMLT